MLQHCLDAVQIAELLNRAGIGRDQVADTVMLDGGTFNSVYRLTLADGGTLILKVAPPADVPVLSHEHGLLGTEALLYRLAAERLVGGVPAVVHDGAGFIVLTEVPGRPWPSVARQLDGDQRRRLREDLGRLVADLHRIRGDRGFGYPSLSLGPLAPTWRAAFSGMLDAVLADAQRSGATLPRPSSDIRNLAAAHGDALDEVTTPVLVHYDLWDGNILVDTAAVGTAPADANGADGRTPRIGGLIDAERAFWGDPLADFVSLALLSDIRQDTAFLDGYRQAGGPAELDGSSEIRLALYSSYLYLIMLAEMSPRSFTPAERQRREASVIPALAEQLDTLDRL